jgi:putative inorganic carbon (hco3(-)) transporter
MNALPIDYLHLETGAIVLFLAMAVRTEFLRAADPEYDVLRGFSVLRWLPFAFVVMAVSFTYLLKDLSPFLGLELAAGITLSLLHPVNALCFMIHLMILRPWELAPADQILGLIPRFGVTLCILSWLIHPEQHKRPDWRSLRSVLFLIGFSGWLLATAVKAPSLVLAVQDWVGTYFKTLMVFGMVLFFIESERSVREVELTLVISSLSLMASGIYQYLFGQLTMGRLKLSGKLADPNDMGSVIAMSLPFALVPFFEETTGPLAKTAILFYAIIAGVAIWFTRSRGTMLAVLAEVFAVRVVRSRKKGRLGLFLTAGLLAGGYFGLLNLVPRDTGEMAASEGSRLTFWKSAVNMAVHNPILGVGYDQYPDNYMSYAVGTIYERGARTAHSSWFLALGESGFPGFFLFCAFFISVARIAWRNRAKRPGQLYAVVGYGVAMSFLSHTYSLYYYILMALVLASAGVKQKVPGGV